MNPYEVINDWLKQYEPIGSWLYFNSTPVDLGTTSMNTVPGKSIKKFIDGSKEITLNFRINLIKEYDEGTSTVNLEAIKEVGSFTSWIIEQDSLKNYPDFGDKIETMEISVLTDVPSLGVNRESMLAQYSFSAKVVYRDESEVI
jgi:hypothetical protein